MENLDSVISNLSLLKNIYDLIRIVDPLLKRTIYYHEGQVEIKQDSCYAFWKSQSYCPNCISMRAYNENNTFVKIEYNKEKIFMVTASPLTLNDNKYILEMTKDITDTGIVENIEDKTTEELQKIVMKMNDVAIVDELTGIYNRRLINEKLPIEILKSISTEKPLSLIMGDIDHFKYINDSYGHLAGDRILCEFALVLKSAIKKDVDWVARYGGEEFIIALEDVDNNEAYEISEKIRKEIEKKAFKWENNNIKITASFGIGTLDKFDANININDLIDCADKKLYEAKRTGRNKTAK